MVSCSRISKNIHDRPHLQRFPTWYLPTSSCLCCLTTPRPCVWTETIHCWKTFRGFLRVDCRSVCYLLKQSVLEHDDLRKIEDKTPTTDAFGSKNDGVLERVELHVFDPIHRADHCYKPLPLSIHRMHANLSMHFVVDDDRLDEVASGYPTQHQVNDGSAPELPIGNEASTFAKSRRIVLGPPYIFAWGKPGKVGIVFPIVRLVQKVLKPSGASFSTTPHEDDERWGSVHRWKPFVKIGKSPQPGIKVGAPLDLPAKSNQPPVAMAQTNRRRAYFCHRGASFKSSRCKSGRSVIASTIAHLGGTFALYSSMQR